MRARGISVKNQKGKALRGSGLCMPLNSSNFSRNPVKKLPYPIYKHDNPDQV